ncbi:hypothetical protein [uncultured Caulobacter sp.]|uniref:hypothetical protein n=1 Tax=uncultured Caulobacter sp. TaxID=158749 RepID=UPI00261BA3BE|nr:hypothetical protein [uncultured Caulobacter sp.]
MDRAEAIASARKLCRSLSGAPLPLARAKELFRTLARAQGWTVDEERDITALGVWLETHPSPSVLKDRCERLLNTLGKA